MRVRVLKFKAWKRGLIVAIFTACGFLSIFADEAGPWLAEISTNNESPVLNSVELKATRPILIYDPSVAAGAEAALRQSFDATHDEFLADLYTASKKHRLAREQTTNPGFERFVQWFRKKRPEFPLSSSLAIAWACGDAGEERKEQLASTLRSVMTNFVVPKWLPEAEIRPVYGADSQRFGPGLVASNFLSTTEARSEVYRTLGLGEPLAGTYVCEYLRENCLEVASPQNPVPTSDRGIVAGPIVENRPSGVESPGDRPFPDWRSQLKRELSTINSGIELGAAWLTRAWSANPLFVTGVGALCLTAVIGVVVRRDFRKELRSNREVQTAYTVVLNPARNETIFLPVMPDGRAGVTSAETASSSAVLAPPAEGTSVLLSGAADPEWENRVLASEKRAQELMSKIRAGLAPHLAQAMVNELVQRLLMDRAALLQAQHIATGELKKIETRFARMQEELAERLRSFQERNVELEKELSVRSVQNRELLRAQIESLERKLD